MSYRWGDHTAEMELRIEAETERGVFEDALCALAELLGDEGGPPDRDVEIAVASSDRAALLADWLNELVFRAEAEDLVPDAVERLDLDERGLRALVRAHRGTPRHVVKGATYHDLRFGTDGRGRYRASVVLDV